MIRTLPYCFYPTTIVLIDDDRFLLDSIASRLNSQFRVKTFSSPVEALKFLRAYEENPFTKLCVRHPEKFHLNIRNIQVEIRDIYKNLFENNRFDNISVIVSDYSMPEMTGAQIFNELYPLNCKKIMFTGEASDTEGLLAFNNGVIDRFCRKSASPVLMSVIFEDMQLRYFQEKSVALKESLEQAEAPLPHCMLNTELVAPLMNLLKSKRIVELYLYSNEGYFLTVTDTGELNWLVVHSGDEIDTLNNMVSHLHQEAPSPFSSALIQDLQRCKKTLFFPRESEANTSLQHIEKWKSFVLPTEQILTSNTDFYYAFKPVNAEDLPLKPFRCFDQASLNQ